MSVLRLSHPGQAARLVDLDPYAALTARQRQVLDVVRSYGGNRSRAARQLAVTVQTVQCVMRIARAAGIRIAGDHRGADRTARWSRKLTPDDVRAIRSSGEMTHVLAARYGVGRDAVKGIRNGRYWRSIP